MSSFARSYRSLRALAYAAQHGRRAPVPSGEQTMNHSAPPRGRGPAPDSHCPCWKNRWTHRGCKNPATCWRSTAWSEFSRRCQHLPVNRARAARGAAGVHSQAPCTCTSQRNWRGCRGLGCAAGGSWRLASRCSSRPGGGARGDQISSKPGRRQHATACRPIGLHAARRTRTRLEALGSAVAGWCDAPEPEFLALRTPHRHHRSWPPPGAGAHAHKHARTHGPCGRHADVTSNCTLPHSTPAARRWRVLILPAQRAPLHAAVTATRACGACPAVHAGATPQPPLPPPRRPESRRARAAVHRRHGTAAACRACPPPRPRATGGLIFHSMGCS